MVLDYQSCSQGVLRIDRRGRFGCRIDIRSSDVQESLEKIIHGCRISLSSPRLVIPTAL